MKVGAYAIFCFCLLGMLGMLCIIASRHQSHPIAVDVGRTNNSQNENCYMPADADIDGRCITHALPHRAVTELTNWGQGRAPEANHCPPGTVQFEVENLFLECLRGTD